MNEDTDLGLRLRDRALDSLAEAARGALDSLAEAARELADANDRAGRVYHGPTLNEQAALSLLRTRLAEFDQVALEVAA